MMRARRTAIYAAMLQAAPRVISHGNAVVPSFFRCQRNCSRANITQSQRGARGTGEHAGSLAKV